MKRAITIIAAFVVAALLTVAAQATSRETLVFRHKDAGLGAQAVCLPGAGPQGSVEPVSTGQRGQAGELP